MMCRADAYLDAMLRHRGAMFFVRADVEDSAMHLGVQRLHAAVHHLGKGCQIGNIAYLEAGITHRSRGSPGGDQLNAQARQLAGKLDQSGLVRHAQKGPLNLFVSRQNLAPC